MTQAPPAAGLPETAELSSGEKLLWLADRPDAVPPPFFDCPPSLSIVVRLKNHLSHAALEASLAAIVRRHEGLRSAFPESDGRPVKVVMPRKQGPLPEVDLRGLPAGRRSDLESHVLACQVARPFELARGPLLRASLLAVAGQEHVLAVTVHHIVFDSWSRRVLAVELTSLYEAYATGRPARLAPLAAGYRDYVRWQQRRLAGERGRALVDYWRTRLSGLTDCVLPGEGPRPPRPSTRAGTCRFTIPSPDARRVHALSRHNRVTVATTMLAIMTLLLHRVSGTDDIAAGVPLSDRRRHEFEGLIGLFANVVVVRSAVKPGMTFLELLRQVETTLTEAYCYQDLPYGDLMRLVDAQQPLYRVVFNFLPGMQAPAIGLRGLHAEPLAIGARPRSLADVSVHIQDTQGALACRFVYKADVFSANRIQELARQFQVLVTAVMNAPEARLSAYDLAPPQTPR